MDVKIACLCVFRDAKDLLPGFLQCVTNYVDQMFFFDDRSAEPARPIGIYSERLYGRDYDPDDDAPHKYESENRELLLRKALDFGVTHVLTLDVDERPEKGFLRELRRGVKAFVKEGENPAISLQVRDLWGDLNKYRTDWIWATKKKVVLFPLKPFDKYWAPGDLHRPWMPPGQEGIVMHTQFNLYHLGSMTPELRAARAAKFDVVDPEHKWQADYSYLAKEDGIVLETIPEGRGWR